MGVLGTAGAWREGKIWHSLTKRNCKGEKNRNINFQANKGSENNCPEDRQTMPIAAAFGL